MEGGFIKGRSILTSLVMAIACLSTSICMAKSLNLYDQPKADAKVVGTINSDTGIIPIFTPKEGEWIKVGDPQNGNVGWLKQSDLQAIGISFTQNIISTGNGTNSFNLIQVPTVSTMTPEQTKAMVKHIQENQQAVQKAMSHVMQDIFSTNYEPFPVMVPVIIVPEKQTQPATKK